MRGCGARTFILLNLHAFLPKGMGWFAQVECFQRRSPETAQIVTNYFELHLAIFWSACMASCGARYVVEVLVFLTSNNCEWSNHREEGTMSAPLVGMHFLSFLILLILSALAAAVLHWLIRYRLLTGIDGFFAKWIAAWIGAWLGPAVAGHWFGSVILWNIYIIPALTGAFVGGFGATAGCRATAKIRPQMEVLGSIEHPTAA